MGQFVDLKSADGFVLPAWVAEPDTGRPRGAVVVLQRDFSGELPHPRGGRPLCRAPATWPWRPPRSTASSPVWSWATPPTTCRLAWA